MLPYIKFQRDNKKICRIKNKLLMFAQLDYEIIIVGKSLRFYAETTESNSNELGEFNEIFKITYVVRFSVFYL